MPRYLVIRFSSIGDIVLTTPVIRCLKHQTQAEIHFVTKQSYAGILENNPYIDKVYTIEHEVTEIAQELKEEDYDFVIDLHNNLRSLRLKKHLKKPSASFPKLNPKKFLLTKLKWNLMPDLHVVDRYFVAAQQLNIKNDGKGLDYFIPVSAEVDLETHQIPAEYIAFSIGAKFATKRLPNEKIIEIINRINLPVVLLGGPEDEVNATEITRACENVFSLVGKLSLDESASVLQQSQKVITHDTGLMHIAAALKKPIISIWGNTVPALGMYPYLPENEELYTIFEVDDLKCRPCSKIGFDKCPKGHFKCMVDQDVKRIVNVVNTN